MLATFVCRHHGAVTINPNSILYFVSGGEAPHGHELVHVMFSGGFRMTFHIAYSDLQSKLAYSVGIH